MIDFKKIRPCNNKYVDGELEDGKFVELKANIPRNLEALIRQIVAMANSVGGLLYLVLMSEHDLLLDYKEIIVSLLRN